MGEEGGGGVWMGKEAQPVKDVNPSPVAEVANICY